MFHVSPNIIFLSIATLTDHQPVKQQLAALSQEVAIAMAV